MNPNYKAVLEIIQLVVVNLAWAYNIKYTYIYGGYPWLVVLAYAVFKILSTQNRLKGYTPGQLLFGRDMVLPNKYMPYW